MFTLFFFVDAFYQVENYGDLFSLIGINFKTTFVLLNNFRFMKELQR